MYFFPNKPRLFSVLTQPHCHSMGYFLLEKNSFRQQHSAKKILIYIIAFFRLFYFLKIALKRHSILYIQKRKIFCLKSVKRLVCPEKKWVLSCIFMYHGTYLNFLQQGQNYCNLCKSP